MKEQGEKMQFVQSPQRSSEMTQPLKDAAAAQRKLSRRQRRWMKRLALSTVLAGFAAGGWAYDDATPPTGLKGILPAEVPEMLAADAFSPLGPNWETWNQGTVQAIDAFYKMDGDLAAQQKALAGLKKKLGVLDRAIASPEYAVIVDPLLAIRGPLARRIAIAEAALSTLTADPKAAREAALKESGNEVSRALADLKADLNAVPGGNAWLGFIYADALTKAVAEGGNAKADALQGTLDRLAKRETLTDTEQKAFLSRATFVKLEEAVKAHQAVLAQAASAVDVPKTREALADLVAALEDYEYTNSAVAAGDVGKALEKLSGVAPDAGLAMRHALEKHYSGNNLRIAASENFLNRLLADSRVEQGQVNDYVLGAAVGGWQTTSTTVTVDTKPSKDRIVFDLVLGGIVQSSTAGRTDQATIYTSGYHTFRSVKEIAYDGIKFTTGPAVTGVNANNTTTGATTRLTGAPLFGQMAQRIAMREAAARRPQSEAIAAGRVSSNVTPKFNAEADKAFADATKQLNGELYQGLKETGLYPDQQWFSSTDSQISILSRLMGEGKLGGSDMKPMLLAAGTGAVMQMHESAVNNAIDQMEFNGKKMNEQELRAHLEAFLSKALARDVKLQGNDAATAPAPAENAEPKEPARLVFAEYDPIRVQFRDGQLLLTIRAGLERENNEPIPPHEIVVPLKFVVNGDKITITRDALQVLPIEGGSSPVQLRVMNDRISSALPDRTVDGVFKLRGPNREVTATVKGIKVVDGWIAVQAE